MDKMNNNKNINNNNIQSDRRIDDGERRRMIITAIITALPILLGLMVYNRLPEQVGIHFDNAGNIDSYAPKVVAVFGVPAFLVVIQLVVAFSLMYDPKKMNQGIVIKKISMWIVPIVSIVAQTLTLLISLGYKINIGIIVVMLTGILIIILGNYLPKCRQNYTIGIKLPWTLHDEDNWNKTHRLAGFLWILGGFAVIASCILRMEAYIMLPVMVVISAVPIIYSFVLYRGKKTGA